MKTIFRLMVLFFFVAGLTSCNDDDEVVIEPTLEVNFANIAGTWYLSEWNGTKLDDSRYFYITFNRKAVDGKRTYEIYQNFDSATSRHITGSFDLEHDEDWGDIISGEYDFWMGEWSSFYIITELRSDSMIWTVKEDAGDISVYTRCAEVPADIIAGTRVIQ